MNTPKEKKYYMPPEWHQHQCCWMQWPYENPNHDGYGSIPSWSHFDFEKGRLAWANVAKSIVEFEKVKMIVHPNNIKNANHMLDSRIEIIEHRLDDCWARDSGAIFLLNHEENLIGDSN